MRQLLAQGIGSSFLYTRLVKPIEKALKNFFCWLVLWFMDLLQDIYDVLEPYLPDLSQVPGGTELIQFLGMADNFVPVGAIISSTAGVLTCFVFVMTIRLIRRFLPF